MKCREMHGGVCGLGLHGGSPSHGVCMMCDSYDGPPRGLGDIVDAVASATRIKQLVGDCAGCSGRRIALNAAVPFPDRAKEG